MSQPEPESRKFRIQCSNMAPNVQDVPIKEENATIQKNVKSNYSSRQLPEKKFESRTSILTALIDNNQSIKILYHGFLAYLFCLFVNSLVRDYLTQKTIKSGYRLISLNFGHLDILLYGWLGFNILTCLSYFCFVLWAKVKIQFSPKSKTSKIWDFLWISLLIAYYLWSFYLSSLIVIRYKILLASSLAFLLEQTRLLMKIHSFVRTTAPTVLSYKQHSDVDLLIPSFSKFFYFLFAPTLIYRNEYPRTKEIRWNFILSRILEVLGGIVFLSFLFEDFVEPCREFGRRNFSVNEVIVTVFENTIMGIIAVVSAFYIILHSWQNIFAELLRFGDRQFYKDWWASCNLSEYFRTWNVLVHDWLYTYVYKDMYEIVMPGKKSVAKWSVFAISVLVHEWFITLTTGYFFPITGICFFLSAVCTSVRPPIAIANILFLYCMGWGGSIILSLESFEYYARMNTQLKSPNVTNYFSIQIMNYID